MAFIAIYGVIFIALSNSLREAQAILSTPTLRLLKGN
jgi:hypothetical protein